MIALDSAASVIAGMRRAAARDELMSDRLSGEWRKLTELASIVREWQALARHAIEPTPFEPEGILPTLRPVHDDVGAALIWTRATPRRLAGLLPARIETHRYGFRLPILVGWTPEPDEPGTPLIDRTLADCTLAAWLDLLATAPTLPALAMLPALAADGPLATRLADVMARLNLPHADLPSLAREGAVDRFISASPQQPLTHVMRLERLRRATLAAARNARHLLKGDR